MRLTVALLLSLCTSASAQPDPRPSTSSNPTLYSRLGGKKGVTRLSNRFVDVIVADKRLLKNETLKKISRSMNRPKVKANLAERICTDTGGPCKFRGEVVNNIPPGFRLGGMEWLYIIEDSKTALDAEKVPNDVQMEVLQHLFKAQKSDS